MPLDKQIPFVLLIHEPWLYQVSQLRAADAPLDKHKDKVNYLNQVILPKEVGRCFVDLLVAEKTKADKIESGELPDPSLVNHALDSSDEILLDGNDLGISDGIPVVTTPSLVKDWSDYIDKKVFRILTNLHFVAWYAKKLEELITKSSSSELTADGVIERFRQDEISGSKHVSVSKLNNRVNIIQHDVRELRGNMIKNAILPNALLFQCLIDFYDCSVDNYQKKPSRPRNIYSEYTKGGQDLAYIYPLERPYAIHNNINIEIADDLSTKHTYKYSCDEHGYFAINYSNEIQVMGQPKALLVNSEGVTLEVNQYDLDINPTGEFLEVHILEYATKPENRTGTITIEVVQ